MGTSLVFLADKLKQQATRMISMATLALLIVSAYALPAERESTTTTTTTDTCLAFGETCLSFDSGALGECCDGSMMCSDFVPGVGFVCSSFGRSETTTTTTTTDICLASGETCLSFDSGDLGECCDGSMMCSVYAPGVGFACSSAARSESTTTTTTEY